jgi:hypothetical protein
MALPSFGILITAGPWQLSSTSWIFGKTPLSLQAYMKVREGDLI